MRTGSRAGFTLIELMTVVVIIGLLASIAVPHISGMKRRAVASSIYADMHAIRIAALSRYTETNQFPADEAPGVVPGDLVSELPGGFSFVYPDYTYDWHTWSVPPATLVGVRVSSTDPELITQLARMSGPGFIPVVTPTQVTFLISTN